MSSVNPTQLSDAEIELLTAKINALSVKEKVPVQTYLQTVLQITNKPADGVLFLHKWLTEPPKTEIAVKINASETTVSKITEVFQLGEEQTWELVENDSVEVPKILKCYLQDLKKVLYDSDSEATCRIAVDLILIQCRKYLLNKHQSAETSHDTETTIADATNPSTPVAKKPAVRPTKFVKLYPEASLSITMDDPFEPHRQILVTGRADWAFGYSIDGDKGALLVAIEAKRASEFSKGEAQLIAYLAILRENRLRAKKTNIITQGFYSDGSRYEFISITKNGTINRSRTFNISFESDLKMVFNFIITMMETAMKSTPNASPTKPDELQKKEVDQFESEVWLKLFGHKTVAEIICHDDDMEDVFG